jgi:hypothetical protein
MRTSSARGAASLRATRPLRSIPPNTRAFPPKSPPLHRQRTAGPRHHHTRGTGEHRITAGRYARRPPLRRDVPLVAGLRG